MIRRRPWLCLLAVLVPAGALFAQDNEEPPPPRFRTVPWAILVGAGTDFDSYSLTLAARRGGFGLGFGYRRNTKIDVPGYSMAAAPSTATTEATFEMTKIGLDFYAAYPIADGIMGYATIGGYTKINTILVRDTVTSQWFRSVNDPDLSGADVAYGAGLEITPLDWLITGIGYHSVRGFNIHLGYTW